MKLDKMFYQRTDSILIPLKTSQPKICAYCNEPIENNNYTLKWFPADAKFMPIHSRHLVTTNIKQSNERNT